MLVIRLARQGTKHKPIYRLTVADSRRSPRGRFIEKLGFYDPFLPDTKKGLKLDIPKIESWIHKGAQPTRRVKSLVKKFKNFDQSANNEEIKGFEKSINEEDTNEQNIEKEMKGTTFDLETAKVEVKKEDLKRES